MLKKTLILLLLALQPLWCEEPTAFFLSWTGDPLTSIAVRWLTPLDQKGGNLSYHKEGEEPWQAVEHRSKPLPGGVPYLLHSAEIVGLKPDSDYHFQFSDGGKTHRFQTLPEKLELPLRFVVGGDMYHDTLAPLIETHKQAAATSPRFALLGGDLAYSTPRLSWWFWAEDFSRWLDWLKAWTQEMVTPEGRVIPLISVIGNHEVRGRFGRTTAEAECFYALFPMVGPQGYNVVDFGNYMSIFLLDSGHTHPIGGDQKEWLKKSLKARREKPHLFAGYHVPAYPSVRRYGGAYNKAVRDNWVPLFEQNGLTAAFEHHDHAYKRTVPLYEGQRDEEKGVLYLGDGAWGVEKPRHPMGSDKLWYLANSRSARHFILVSISPEGSSFAAVESDGTIFDTATRSTK